MGGEDKPKFHNFKKCSPSSAHHWIFTLSNGKSRLSLAFLSVLAVTLTIFAVKNHNRIKRPCVHGDISCNGKSQSDESESRLRASKYVSHDFFDVDELSKWLDMKLLSSSFGNEVAASNENEQNENHVNDDLFDDNDQEGKDQEENDDKEENEETDDGYGEVQDKKKSARLIEIDDENESEEMDDDIESTFNSENEAIENDDESIVELDGSSDNFLPLPARIVPLNKDVLVNFRTTKCTYFCQLALEQGFKISKSASTNPFKTPPEMMLISYKRYMQYSGMKRTIINQVGRGSSCIGGGKGRQLNCRTDLAAKDGCPYDDLKLQPRQWNIQNPITCKEFFNHAASPALKGKIWIAKPGGSYHGKGITIHDDIVAMKKQFGGCERVLAQGLIIQEYIANPALMGGHKFDFRSYLLIASTDPMIVFYHDGFVRRASGVYSTDSASLKDPLKQVTNDVNQQDEDHFFDFDQLQAILHREDKSGKFVPRLLEEKFVPHAMRVTNYLFHTAWNTTKGLISTPGRWQIFALDWMVDKDANFHLLEANGNPLITGYPGIKLTPDLWTTLLRLEKLLHTDPEALLSEKQTKANVKMSVEQGYRFGGWKLVYNQVEAESKGMRFQACKFHEYSRNKHPLFSYHNFIDK